MVFFVITVSEDENVYVQGTRSSGNLFLFEAVGPKYTKKINPKIMQQLLKLGWSLPSGEGGNYDQVISVDQILNNHAGDMLFETLTAYDAEYNGKNLTYSISF